MPPLLRINKFDYGITDVFSRGDSPEGSFVDLRNLLPVKVRGLQTSFGYTQAISALPTGFTDGSGATLVLESIEWHPYSFSAEKPSTYDGRVYLFKDTGGAAKANYHFALDTWFDYMWKGNDTAVSDNSGFVLLDERDQVVEDGTPYVTISGASTYDIVVTAANSVHGLNINNDYYNGWRMEWLDDGPGTTDYAYVVNYAIAANVATFTVKEDIGSSGRVWTNFTTGDSLTLRRWFHRPDAINQSFDPTNPGDCFASEGRVRGCGAADSDEDYFPWIAQYINRTFMKDDAMEETYRGTYVDTMECSHEANESGVDILTGSTLGTGGGGENLPAGDYEMGYTLEYDGYQESRLGPWVGPVTANGSSHTNVFTSLYLSFARMSKRVTAINIYARQSVGGIQSQAYFIKRLSLTDPTTAEIAKWFVQTGADAGRWRTTGTDDDAMSVDGDEWLNKGGSYYARTGRFEELDGDRHIVAWRHTINVAGRQFYSYFYCPTDAETYVDQVRYTGLRSSGASSYDVIPYDRDEFEFDIEGYQGDVVTGLAEDAGWLIMFKESSIHARYVTAYRESWSPLLITADSGCSSRHSIVYLPEGIGFSDTDGYKLLVNQRVIWLTNSLENTYKAFDGGFGEIRAWWEPIDGSLRITDGVDTTNRYVWVCYVNRPQKLPDGRPAFPWYKLQLPTYHYVEWVTTDNDGTTAFTNSYGTFQGVFSWSRTAVIFHTSNWIRPFAKTHLMVPDEALKVSVDKVIFVKSGNADGGTLKNDIYIDGVQISFSDEDKAKTHLFQKIAVDATQRKGRSIQVAYNQTASGEYSEDEVMELHEIQVFGTPEEAWNESE